MVLALVRLLLVLWMCIVALWLWVLVVLCSEGRGGAGWLMVAVG